MKRKWVRAAVGGVLVAITMTAGLFVAGRVSAWVLGVDPFFEWARPTMADVLDGRVANGERLAGLREVSELSERLNDEDVARVGEIEWTVCGRGQNNFKVHDGFRLNCEARLVSYLAWSGDYKSTAEAVNARIEVECPYVQLAPVPRPPVPGAPTTVAIYQCPNSMTVIVHYESAEQLSVSDSVLSVGETSTSARRIAGSSPSELSQELLQYQWFARIAVAQTYYEDRP